MEVSDIQKQLQNLVLNYDVDKHHGENMHCGKPMVTIVRQIRSADEPPTTIKKCEVCLYSIKKS